MFFVPWLIFFYYVERNRKTLLEGSCRSVSSWLLCASVISMKDAPRYDKRSTASYD